MDPKSNGGWCDFCENNVYRIVKQCEYCNRFTCSTCNSCINLIRVDKKCLNGPCNKNNTFFSFAKFHKLRNFVKSIKKK